MLKKTPFKKKESKLKKTSLKKCSGHLETSSSLAKTELKKQNEKAKAKWEEIRDKVLIRDNYKCVVCGKPATQVHHIHLRSKRKDLLYEMNNLVSLCDKHHDHSSENGLERVNRRIAEKKGICLELLLKIASMKDEEYENLKIAIDNAREYIQSVNCLKNFKEGEINGTNN